MLELYLLQQLLAFYECGTLSKAAKQLNIAQPSLSRSMKRLEESLGVPLFNRTKNRISLNSTGIVAAEHARLILKNMQEMRRHVKAFDRSQHTLTVGSCAPGPLMELLPTATVCFPSLTIASAVHSEKDLLNGLETDEYGIIILTRPLENPQFFCHKYIFEQLFLSVASSHPAASLKEISFSDMDGQTFIMYAHVGFWDEIVRQKMPRAKFLLQADIDSVGEIARYSNLPSFASTITLQNIKSRQNDRISIPFTDSESRADYYLICHKRNRQKLQPLFRAVGNG